MSKKHRNNDGQQDLNGEIFIPKLDTRVVPGTLAFRMQMKARKEEV